MERVGKGRKVWRGWGKGGRYGEGGEREEDMECEEGRKIWRVWGKGRRYGECGEGREIWRV